MIQIFNQISIEGLALGFAVASLAFGMLVIILRINHKKTGDMSPKISPLSLLENFDGMAYACLIDKDWTMTYVNSNAYKVLGYTSEEVVGNHLIAYNDIIHPKYREFVRNRFSDAIENHEDIVIDYMIVSKSGQEKWVREEAHVTYDAFDQPLQIEGYIYDIEETKSLIYDKNIYQFKYQSLFDGLDIPLLVIKEDQVIDANPSALRFFRADTKHQLVGKQPLNLIDPSYHAFYHSRIKRIHETKTANLMADYKLKRLDGSDVLVTVDAKPYFNHGELYLNVLIGEKDDLISQNQKLRKTERRNRDLLLFMKEGLGVFQVIPDTLNGKLIYSNQRFSQFLFASYQNLLYRQFTDLFDHFSKQDYQRIFDHERKEAYQKEFYDKEQDRYIQSYFYFNNEGELIVQLTDISKEKKLLQQHQDEKQTLDEILEATGTMIWSWNRLENIISYDQRTYDILGYQKGKSDIDQPRKILFYLHPDDRKQLMNQLRDYFDKKIPYFSVEVRIRDVSGNYRWWMIRGKGIHYKGDVPTLVSGTIQDVTHHKRMDEEIRFLSLHDQLTKVFNLRAFEEQIEYLDIEENYPISMALIDVNGLKVFNDAFNHSVGDELLIKTANTLVEYSQDNDVVARVGGDEFVLIMPKTSLEEAEERFIEIEKNLKQQTVSNIPISVSYGIEVKFNKRFTMHQIKDMADSKMYKHKFNGKDTRLAILEQIRLNFFKENNFEQQVVDLTHDLSMTLARDIGLDLETLSVVDIASQYYNIGIFSVRKDVINDERKFKKYDEIEYKKHVENGYRIMLATYRNERIAMAILHHHEKYNGQGYPSQIKSKKIPITSRIISICATYARRYLLKHNIEDVLDYIQSESNISFDPELVKVFTKMIKRAHEN